MPRRSTRQAGAPAGRDRAVMRTQEPGKLLNREPERTCSYLAGWNGAPQLAFFAATPLARLAMLVSIPPMTKLTTVRL